MILSFFATSLDLNYNYPNPKEYLTYILYFFTKCVFITDHIEFYFFSVNFFVKFLRIYGMYSSLTKLLEHFNF